MGQYSYENLRDKNLNQQIEQQKSQPAINQQESEIPSPVTSEQVTPLPIGGGLRGSQFVVPQPTLENSPYPKPFMALNQTADGRPLFGTGFKGWVRKLWADISDPYKLLQDTEKLSSDESSAIWESYNQNVEKSGQIIEDKLRWSTWGEKMFGITAEEVAALTAGGKAERDIAELSGDSQIGTAISRSVAIARDTTQNVIWGGLDILSSDDGLMRKIHSTIQGVDAVADKFNKDEPSNFLEELYSSNPISLTRDLYTIHQNVKAGNTTWTEAGETIKKFSEGSAMAYTMVFDQYRKEEFERRVANGEDEQVVAEDLGVLSTEIAGSILGSPSTYLGLNIVKPINIFSKAGNAVAEPLTFLGRNIELFGYAQKVPWRTVARIPTFGEIISVNVGKARLMNVSKRYVETSPLLDGLESIVKNVDNVADENQAIKILENASNFYTTKLNDMSKQKQWWNLATLDSSGKVAVTTKESSMFIQSLVGREGVDTSLQIMRDLVLINRGGQNGLDAAGRLLSRNNSNLLLSDVSLMAAEIVNRLDSDSIFDSIQKLGKNPIKLHEDIFGKLEKALSDFVPSVDEMWDASKAVKDVGKNLPTDPAELNKYSKNVQLAKQWDALHPVVKTVRTVTKVPENIAKKTTSIMTYAFMNLVSRAWARGISGQFWGIAAQQGLKNALETTIASVAGLNPKATRSILDSNNDLIVKRLGYMPSTSARNIKDFTKVKSFGVLPAIGRSEDIAASQIMVNSINETILKSLPATVKNLPEWDALVNSLPREQQGLLFHSLKRAYGNFDEAVSDFRKLTGSGEIDSWRLTDPPENMRVELEQMGMLDAFYDVQRNAKTMEEFTGFVDNFVATYKNEVTKLAENLPSTASLPNDLLDWGKDLNKLPDRMSNVIRDLYQGWQNTFDKLDENTQLVLGQADKLVMSNPQAFDALQQIKSDIHVLNRIPKSVYRQMDTVRSEVVPLIKRVSGMSQSEIVDTFTNFKVTYKGKNVFSLADIYPDLDPATLDNKKAVSLLWEAMFENTASAYRNNNLGSYNGIMDKLNEIGELFGGSLDDIAKSGTAFRDLDDLRRMTLQIEDSFSWQRLFRTVNFKPDLDLDAPVSTLVDDFKKLHPDWDGDVKIYDGMTISEAISAFNKRKRVPPYNPDVLPDELRSKWEGMGRFTQDIRDWSDTVVKDWGVKIKTLPVQTQDLVSSAKKAYKTRFDVVQATAGVVAESERNFALHDYQKTYLDHALTLLLGNSFHYWTTRTYSRALETLVDNPKYANMYLQYKEYLQEQHSDLPDWYKQNLQINSLFGINLKNPLYVNLESMINPMYNLTGTDFDDPNKRVDWLSRTIDDMSKMGPGFSPLISWAVAMHLYNKGEEDAATRWTNRLLPQSQIIKSGSAVIGDLVEKASGNKFDLSPLEVDPFTSFLDGGVDPYERNRVSVALAFMVRDGVITQEQMIEAARMKEGDIWKQAVELSAEKRFMGDFTSFFFGAGVRPRTEQDVIVEKFWNDYGILLGSRDLLTPEQYRQRWDNMRENPDYGMFVDALLVSRKTGDEQDTAYSYNVLGRIPPGQMSQIAGAVGIEPEMLEAFYTAKGDFDEMGLTPQDQARFMAGVADIGAILAMPSNPTRAEWTRARTEKDNMEKQMEDLFGDGVMDAIYEFYESPNKADFLDDFPEVQQALDFQTNYVNSNPLLSRYYGGMDSVQQYYKNATENILIKEFGAENMELYEEYNNPQISPERKKELGRILKGFLSRRSDLREQNLQAMADIALLLPDPPQPEAQDDITPQGVSQNNLFQLTQPALTPQQWEEIVGSSTMQIVQDFIYNGEEIPYVVSNNLDYLAEQNGYSNGDDMLMQIIQSLPQVAQ